MHHKQLTAIIHKEDDVYVSLCPELDIASQGNTIEEAKDNLKEAVELFFECASAEEINGHYYDKTSYKSVCGEKLVMEFFVEAQVLLGLRLEGSVS